MPLGVDGGRQHRSRGRGLQPRAETCEDEPANLVGVFLTGILSPPRLQVFRLVHETPAELENRQTGQEEDGQEEDELSIANPFHARFPE